MSPCQRVAGVEVLQSCEEDFIKHIDAKVLSEALQSKKVIPEHIERKIKLLMQHSHLLCAGYNGSAVCSYMYV